MRKHPNQPGPPKIIVKFNNRDIRNDFYDLRYQAREKSDWKCYNIRNLYINEALTPDARKLFYKTRMMMKEMSKEQSRIYVWTFKGEIFVRKDAQNAPKRKISSENELKRIMKGEISLDPNMTPFNIPDSVVIYDDIMATSTADT